MSPGEVALYHRWIMANAIGEWVGLGGATILGWWLAAEFEPALGPVAAAAIAAPVFGLIEGGVVGGGQW